MKFIVEIKNWDGTAEQLEEAIADALDGFPAVNDGEPIEVGVTAIAEAGPQLVVGLIEGAADLDTGDHERDLGRRGA